jgi:hypothetical protein
LASVLKMKPLSARTNVLPTLRKLKLVDTQGKPTPLATKWRDDQEYRAVCDAMIKACYPQELIGAVPSARDNKDAAARWFAGKTGAGKIAVGKMVSFYAMLQEGLPAKQKKPSVQEKPAKSARVRESPQRRPASTSNQDDSRRVAEQAPREPSVHINLQIHISPDASSDQIKDIFQNIAKYIYTKP